MQRKRITYSLVSTSPGTPPVDGLPSLENGKLSALFAKSNLGQVAPTPPEPQYSLLQIMGDSTILFLKMAKGKKLLGKKSDSKNKMLKT